MGSVYYTKQKNIVYQAMVGNYEHPTAEMVLGICRQIMPKISRATIYRNLKELANEKKIKRIELAGEDRFDITTKNHAHFTCECCGEFKDVSDINVDKIFHNGLSGIGAISKIDIVLSGLCDRCKKNAQSK